MQSDVAELTLTDKLIAWFDQNRNQAIYGVVGLIVLGLIVAFFYWRNSEKEIAASEALSHVIFPQFSGEPAANAASFLKVASEYPSSEAGIRAQLLGAGALFTEGKYTEAQAQFERFTREYRTSPLVSEAALGIAASLDAQGKTNEAIASYKSLTERHPGQAVIPQAKFALARMYEAQGKPELAKPLFEEISRGDPYASISSEAGMRLEELKRAHPELFPPPAPNPSLSPSAAIPQGNLPPAPASNPAPFELETK